MPFFKTAAIQLKESRAFQLRVGHQTLTIILVLFESYGQPLDSTLTLELKAPIMLCQVPAASWYILWPNVTQPPGWHSISVRDNVITLQPIISKTINGGLLAYYSSDERVPVLGRTHITWLNDKTGDPEIEKSLAVTWYSILSNTTPRLPISMLRTVAQHSILAPGEYEYFSRSMTQSSASKYTTKVLDQRNPKYLERFLGTGVGVSVLMAVIIWFTAQHKIKKTTK
jgi:hypothetical protein